MMHLVPAVLLALLCLHRLGAAQGRAPALDCSSGPQSALNECAAADFRAADAQLNTAYQAITRRLTDTPARRSLVEAQRAWIRFRDAECEFDTKSSEGGSIPFVEGRIHQQAAVKLDHRQHRLAGAGRVAA